MSLKNNLLRPEFSRDREELINYRLFYEIKKHGLSSGVDYELFPPIIDKNGYDLLVKHGRNLKAFQIKTVAKTSKTSWWAINKRFIKPDNLPDGGLIIGNFSADLAGLGGGVIVVEYDLDSESELKLEYYYFDYQTLYFFQKGLFKWRLKGESYYDIVANLFSEDTQVFKLKKSLLYHTNGIKDLLTISRIEPLNYDLTRENTEAWTFGITNSTTNTKNVQIEINGRGRVLNIYDTGLVRKELTVGDRTFKGINKL